MESSLDFNEIARIMNNYLTNMNCVKKDRNCIFQNLQKEFSHENRVECFSNETYHSCKHVIYKHSVERWDKVLKKYDVSLRTSEKISEQFKLNSGLINKYYSNTGKEVMQQKYAVIEDKTVTSKYTSRIGFLGKGDYEGILTYITINLGIPSVEFNTIFRAEEYSYSKGSNYIINAYCHVMEKMGEVRWIHYPVEIKYLNDIYEVLFNLQSIDKLHMLLDRRAQLLVGIAEETGHIDDIFEAVKSLILYESYEYSPKENEFEKLKKYKEVSSLQERIDKTLREKEIPTIYNESYEEFYALTMELGKKINFLTEVGESQESEFYKFTVWNFCYDWICLKLIHNKLEELKNELNPNDILKTINFSKNKLYKNIMQMHKKAWKLS